MKLRLPSNSQIVAAASLVVAGGGTAINMLPHSGLHFPAWAYMALTILVSVCRSLAPSNSGVVGQDPKAGA